MSTTTQTQQDSQFRDWLKGHVPKCPNCGHAGAAGQTWYIVTTGFAGRPSTGGSSSEEGHLGAACRSCSHVVHYDVAHARREGQE
jgi:hypothetical protein